MNALLFVASYRFVKRHIKVILSSSINSYVGERIRRRWGPAHRAREGSRHGPLRHLQSEDARGCSIRHDSASAMGRGLRTDFDKDRGKKKMMES
jgi:hypothetical protein